jgi:putative Mg2+ transporter-C (MgtC) family protein
MSYESQFEFTLWVLLAVGVGMLIGFQREFRGHEAGIRTSALVCGGAAIFGRVSLEFGDDRVAAGVVQGIGFLGAGLIMHAQDGGVRGATTAATVWVLAALGLVIAQEFWVVALVLAAVYILLLELAPVSDWIYRRGQEMPGSAPPPAEEGFGDPGADSIGGGAASGKGERL